MMSRAFKVVHLLGLALFLGSIFGHIVTSALGGAAGTPAFVAAREHISTATSVLTLPGLALLVLSGIAMAVAGTVRTRWMLLHSVLAAVVVLLTVVAVVPSVSETLYVAREAANGAMTAAEVKAAKLPEDIFGGANVLLTLALIVIGVFKPRLGGRS